MGHERPQADHPGDGAALRRCIDVDRLRAVLVDAGLVREDADDDALVRCYLCNPRAALISPNPLFDEMWYRAAYPDVQDVIAQGGGCGFLQFLAQGLGAGRWPCAALQAMADGRELPPFEGDAFPADAYLQAHRGARLFLRHFPVLDAPDHYRLYGRFIGMALPPPPPPAETFAQYDALAAMFDPAFYRAHHMAPGDDADAFAHYLRHGMPAGHSPSAAFDEAFYRAFYPEVRQAIAAGELPCGLYHYVLAGRAEGRIPRYDRRAALEARAPNVTRPILLDRAEEIRLRMAARRIVVAPDAAPRIWVLLPTINPDITFGGYRSVLELMRQLHAHGRRVSVVCTEDGMADKHYFLWHEGIGRFTSLIEQIEVIGYHEGQSLCVGAADTVLAYSLWDLYAARQIRAVAPATRVVLLAQEYEPIFYDNGAPRALVEEAYRITHFPLINSRLLCRYLQHHRVGVFASDPAPVEGRDFAVFEHRINRLPAQTQAQMQARQARLLVTYARPESHAARNMFEILLLALQDCCAAGLFGQEWQFLGLGALTDMADIPLGGGHVLAIHPKMAEEEYTRHIAAMDIGVSLMFAPHPSVVPFEFATTGAIVVTNEFENRPAAELEAICGNIVAGRPTVDGIATALRRALALVEDTDHRSRNLYRPAADSWEQIFAPALLDQVFGPAG